MERIVRRLTPDDLDLYTEIYLNAYPSGKSISQEHYEYYYNRNLQSMQEYKDVNFFGLFEDGSLISIMKIIDFDINLFGVMKKAKGLMSLAVHPLHKKKGVAKEMVRYFEKYTMDSDGLLCMLLPFNIGYYRRMGYGYGTKLDEYRIPTTQLKSAGDTSRLRLIKNVELDKVLECHSEFVRGYHGAVGKFGEEKRDILSDDRTRRMGYFDGGTLKGYISFDFVSESAVNYSLNRMEVSELVYKDGEVLKSLLGGLRMQADLAQNVVIRTGEADFHYLLDSPQDISGNYINYGHLQTNISAIGTMYKIPDIRAFVENLSYRKFVNENLKVAFRVNEGGKNSEERFGIRFSNVGNNSFSTWSYEDYKEDADAEIIISLADLSSLFMGSADLAPMVRMGVVKIDREEMIDRLDRLFHCTQRPFTNTDY